jgi:hypothetical protein
VRSHGGVEVGHQAEFLEFVREKREDMIRKGKGRRKTSGSQKIRCPHSRFHQEDTC